MRRRRAQGHKYTIVQVNELLRDLRLIQKPRDPGDRINVEYRRVESDNILTSLWRTFLYSDESRTRTIQFIEEKIELAFALAMDYIPRHGLDHCVVAGSPERTEQLRRRLDNQYIERILENISLCISGITSLKDRTYLNDDNVITRLEGMLKNINIKLEACTSMFEPPPIPDD